MSHLENATGALKSEHRVIMIVLDVLECIVHQTQTTRELDFHGWERCLTFFKLFADACHHGKEEDVLFPELEAAGIPRQGGPIGVMLYEHDRGRGLVREMSAALDALRAGGDVNWRQALIFAGTTYIDLLRRHIGKEDHCLFAMADQVLNRSTCARVCDSYRQVCERKLDGLSHEQLQALASQLQSEYIPEAAPSWEDFRCASCRGSNSFEPRTAS
jgi:hemerythrin-like domain-containing protein